ncbi:branched-chain amino acid transport system II carrier protein [Alphaproteobacteria bacterium]|nr:branched-chain amino acid transport system II carrier protein [Alphaproteobacteria bacterium]
MSEYKLIFMYGFALFGMFFGAGNLVFPIKIGQITGEHWMLGSLGLTITGIILPFLGLFVVKLHRGDYMRFFGGAGSLAKLLLPLFMLSLLGSFGAVPRCITVAYGGISQLMPGFSLGIFSGIFCGIAYFVSLKDQRIISIVGKWMTPILLLLLAILFILGATTGNPQLAMNAALAQSFCDGITTGYQTMDLLAAFFFSALVFAQIQKTLPEGTSDKDLMGISIKSGIIAVILLAIVYIGMVFLGSNFSSLIANIDPALMLTTIASHTMGSHATLFMGITIMFACFTTVVALNGIYARYLHSLFGLKSDKFRFILFLTTATSFAVSLFDFNGIARFLAPILEALYPSTIVLTVISIFSKKHHTIKIISFYGILAAVILYKFFT